MHPASRSRVPEPLPIEPCFRRLAGSELFLRAIAENPADDSPRLIFSDWLDEQEATGRAELIRLQVQLEALPAASRPLADAQRARQLEQEVGWRRAPPGVRMSRGLYTQFLLSRQVLRDWCARRGRDERNVASVLRLLGEVRSRIDLQQLTLSVPLEPGPLGDLANSPQLSGVTAIQVAWNSIGSQGAKALSASAELTHLDSLDLWGCGIEAEGARALTAARWAARLSTLNLGSNRLRDDGVSALAQAPGLANLTALELMRNEITAKGMKDLAESPHLANLTSLNLFANEINDRGAKALATSPHLHRLADVDLRGNNLTLAGREAVLGRWPFAKTDSPKSD
jgi:uncharacterized protein (TIGR02996 family)